MSPLVAVALTAATLGLATCAVLGTRAFLRYADRRMGEILLAAFDYDYIASLDTEYEALLEAEDA